MNDLTRYKEKGMVGQTYTLKQREETTYNKMREARLRGVHTDQNTKGRKKKVKLKKKKSNYLTGKYRPNTGNRKQLVEKRLT